MEKNNNSTSSVEEMADYNGHIHTTQIKSSRLLEAAEIYGNVETAEKYGYVTRG
jgi:hypothetical protein